MYEKFITFFRFDLPFFIAVKKVQFLLFLKTHVPFVLKIPPIFFLAALSNMGAVGLFVRIAILLFFGSDDFINGTDISIDLDEPIITEGETSQDSEPDENPKNENKGLTKKKRLFFVCAVIVGTLLVFAIDTTIK